MMRQVANDSDNLELGMAVTAVGNSGDGSWQVGIRTMGLFCLACVIHPVMLLLCIHSAFAHAPQRLTSSVCLLLAFGSLQFWRPDLGIISGIVSLILNNIARFNCKTYTLVRATILIADL